MPRGQKPPGDEIRIRVQCTANDEHAKLLRFNPDESMEMIERLAALIEGNSPAYKFPPGAGSPIGRCAVCRAPLECSIERIGKPPGLPGSKHDAEHRKPVN